LYPFLQTLRFDFTLKKIRVYLSDSLDTIPKKSEADIALGQEKQIKERNNFKRVTTAHFQTRMRDKTLIEAPIVQVHGRVLLLAVLQTDGDPVDSCGWKFIHPLESWRYDARNRKRLYAQGEPQTSHKALVERQRFGLPNYTLVPISLTRGLHTLPLFR